MDNCMQIAGAFAMVAAMVIGFGTFNLGWRDKTTRILQDKHLSKIQIDWFAWWIWLACYLIQIAGVALGTLWWFGIVSFAVGNGGIMIAISCQMLRESIYQLHAI